MNKLVLADHLAGNHGLGYEPGVCAICDRLNATKWTWGRYAKSAAYPEDWIRIEESPGARLVANLPPYREADAIAIVAAHNAEEVS